ncbi:MAG: hypothetical protein ACTSRG_09830 [Candidatus Helarchaeota archaeon]
MENSEIISILIIIFSSVASLFFIVTYFNIIGISAIFEMVLPLLVWYFIQVVTA